MKKPETLQVYETFFDGGPIIEVLLHIDPEPTQPVPLASNLQGLGIIAARIKIFHCIIKNIKAIYEVNCFDKHLSMKVLPVYTSAFCFF